MRRLLGFLMVGLLFAGTAAACSSDSDSDGDTTTTAAGGGSTDTTAGAGGGGSADVEAFCADAEELGQQLQDAVDDPTSADAAAITAQAAELSASAAELTSANPDDVDRINECAALLSVTP